MALDMTDEGRFEALESRLRATEIQLAETRIELRNTREDLKDTLEALHKTNNKVQELFNLLNQGKGAKWVFVGAIGLFGAGGALSIIAALSNILQGRLP